MTRIIDKIDRIQSLTGMSYRQIGEVLGMSSAQISWYKQGRNNPTPETVEKVDHFLNGIESMPSDPVKTSKWLTLGLMGFALWLVGRK